MYCENCGKEIAPGSTLCDDCAGTKKKKSGKKLLWIIPGALAAVAVVLVAALWPKTTTDIAASPTTADASVSGFFDFVLSGGKIAASSDYEQLAEKKEQTFIIYMVGSDLESNYGCASQDISELMNADIDTDKSNFVIFTGGSTYWHNGISAASNSILHLVSQGNMKIIGETELCNMGDPSTLSGFLEYAYYSFPAEQYNLILWDHGNGAILGYGNDRISGDRLYNLEIKQALEMSPFNSNNKFAWIAFNACLMGNIETASLVADYADYMITSEEVISAYGFYYDSFAELSERKHTGPEAAEVICSETIDYLYSFGDSTLSFMASKTPFACLDLRKIGDVEAAMGDLFDELNSDIKSNFAAISRARDASYCYSTYHSDGDEMFDMIDIVQFTKGISSQYPEEAQALIDAVDDMVVWEQNETTYSHGISFYFPFNGDTLFDMALEKYADYDFCEGYTRFIENFVKVLQGEEPTVWENTDKEVEEEPETEPQTTESVTNPTDAPETKPDNDEKPSNGNVVSEIELNLSDKQLDNFLKASKTVYIKNREGGYYLVSKTNDVELEGNSLVADFENSRYYLSDGKNKAELVLVENSRTENEVTYWSPVFASRSGAESFHSMITEGVIVNLLIVFNEEYPDGKVLGYYFDSEEGYDTLYSFEEGTNIMPVTYGVEEKEYDEYGNLKFITDCENVTFFYSETTLEIDDELSLVKGEYYDDDLVYGSIIIYDTHNYRFSTSFRKIKERS